MANNRRETEESPQADMFGDQVHQTAAPVGNVFEQRVQEHVERFLRMLAPSADAYAYALQVFGHIANKVRAIRE